MIARLAVEARLVDRADADSRIPLARGDEPVGQRIGPVGDVDLVGQQVAGLRIAGRLDPAAIFGAMVAHHHRRRLVEPLDLQAGLVPDREADRAPARGSCPASRSQSSAVAISAAAASPSSASNMPHWPVPGAMCAWTSSSTWALIRPTARPPRSASHNLRPRMPEPRILLRIDEAVDFALQRRHPGGSSLIDLPGEIDERPPVGRS